MYIGRENNKQKQSNQSVLCKYKCGTPFVALIVKKKTKAGIRGILDKWYEGVEDYVEKSAIKKKKRKI